MIFSLQSEIKYKNLTISSLTIYYCFEIKLIRASVIRCGYIYVLWWSRMLCVLLGFLYRFPSRYRLDDILMGFVYRFVCFHCLVFVVCSNRFWMDVYWRIFDYNNFVVCYVSLLFGCIHCCSISVHYLLFRIWWSIIRILGICLCGDVLSGMGIILLHRWYCWVFLRVFVSCRCLLFSLVFVCLGCVLFSFLGFLWY